MSINKVAELINSLSEKVANSEKFSTSLLAAKLEKVAENNPYDQTIRVVSNVVSRLHEREPFISRADFRQLYEKHFVRNTTFANHFADELGYSAPTPSIKQAKQTTEAKDVNIFSSADPVLSNALESVFSPGCELKEYSKDIADKAASSVDQTLDSWNLKPNKISIAAGNDKFIIIQADYHTPKGVTSFYVPAEVVANKISITELFVGNTGIQELNNSNVKDYIKRNAGLKLKVAASALINAINDVTSKKKVLSNVDLAVARLKVKRAENTGLSQSGIIGEQILDSEVKDLEIQKLPEAESFEKKFENPYHAASFIFGTENVKLGTAKISNYLSKLGYKGQVTVANTTSNSILYAVALDGKIAFNVPVKVQSGKVQNPTVIISNGSIKSFDNKEISKLYASNEQDYKAAAAVSSLFDLQSSDLINSVRTAMADGNLAKAEDALNVLRERDNKTAYATAFEVYRNGLTTKPAKTAESTCSMQIKTANSKYTVCGHTGLPMHKVYQDKHGNCCPKYRKDLEDNYEVAVFNTSKILG